MSNSITVETTVKATSKKVWECWTKPDHITHWAFASDDWMAPSAENELKVGGRFTTRMEAKDGSAGFDFGGTYTVVEPERRLEYTIGDGRHVTVEFIPAPEGVRVRETFEAENVYPESQQRQGWQAILDNFRKYTESLPD